MQIRNLGGSGLRVSAVGLGCNNFGQRTDLETSRKVIHKAIDLGITLFDTADIYAGMGGSETVLGTVLGDRRKDIVLATKYSKPMATDGTKQGASRRYIMSAVEASLTRLKTDYIDLYQQHDYDPLTPMEETLRALDDLVRQGKVRYIGNSNFPAWRLAEAEMLARQMNVSRFVSCQDEYSLVVRGIEKDLLPAATEYKLGLLPFFPLASGLLTGKYKRGSAAPDDTRFAKAPALKDRYVTPRNEDIVEKLQTFAQARGHTMLELAFENAQSVVDDPNDQTIPPEKKVTIEDVFYSFGISHPGAITLHNFPEFLRNLTVPAHPAQDGSIVPERQLDVAATDIMRDRERGVPRYNKFRQLLGKEPLRSFDELTSNRIWAEEIRDLYGGDIDRVDTQVGMLAEDLPAGFGFSDTAFRVFILMASRRLKSDRFFTTDWTPRTYTQVGMDWINSNDMSSVLLRHYPDLAPALRGVKNAFAPWSRLT